MGLQPVTPELCRNGGRKIRSLVSSLAFQRVLGQPRLYYKTKTLKIQLTPSSGGFQGRGTAVRPRLPLALAEQTSWISNLREVLAGPRPWTRFQVGRPGCWEPVGREPPTPSPPPTRPPSPPPTLPPVHHHVCLSFTPSRHHRKLFGHAPSAPG